MENDYEPEMQPDGFDDMPVEGRETAEQGLTEEEFPIQDDPESAQSQETSSQDARDTYPFEFEILGYADVNAVGPEGVADRYRSGQGAMGPEELEEIEAMEQYLSVDEDYATLPHPDVFNAYPPEVQRKIMEWTDRDVKARRDDESRRQDELMRAKVERDRRRQIFPTIVAVLAIVCAAVTGIITRDPWFAAAFLFIALAVVIGRIASEFKPRKSDGGSPKLM